MYRTSCQKLLKLSSFIGYVYKFAQYVMNVFHSYTVTKNATEVCI
jgi:hypothetical protein